jgi:hypothetical protein
MTGGLRDVRGYLFPLGIGVSKIAQTAKTQGRYRFIPTGPLITVFCFRRAIENKIIHRQERLVPNI